MQHKTHRTKIAKSTTTTTLPLTWEGYTTCSPAAPWLGQIYMHTRIHIHTHTHICVYYVYIFSFSMSYLYAAWQKLR